MRRRFLHLLLTTTLIITKLYGQDAPVSAQTPREKLEAYKVAYLTSQLDLTPAEAEKFWPVYNQYSKEVMEVNRQRIAAKATAAQTGAPMAKSDLEYDQQILNIRKHYYEQFKTVLPPAKVEHLYKAEQTFRAHVIRQLANRKGANTRPALRSQHPGPR